MLLGGMMPIAQLIEIVRHVPPRQAADLLRELPPDRLTAILAGLKPNEIARLVGVASGQFRDTVIEKLDDPRLLDVLDCQAEAAAAEVLVALPDERLCAIAVTLPDHALATLLPALADARLAMVLDAFDPVRRTAILSRRYSLDVADALVRANMRLDPAIRESPEIMLAHGLGWRVVVAAGFHDDGSTAVNRAEDAAYRIGAHSALAVTEIRPSDAVLTYCALAREAGRSVAAVHLTGHGHDGPLKRTLVSLLPAPH